jgi:serine/threonine-protein kinase
VHIGKYEVLAHIATGGMGAVYKARDTQSGQEVALKILSAQLAASAEVLERFRREARAAAALSHQNIVAIHDFGEVEGTCYLALEFVDGTDLHAYIQRKGPLRPDKALVIIYQACRALRHAFRRGIVHRDVKPSNFLLTRGSGHRVVKLTDFGVARQVQSQESRLTCTGFTVGTVDFMPPEQARDSGAADHRSDLYSLGATWYYLLAGQAPFSSGGLGERLLQILSEQPPDVRTLNRRVSPATAAVVHRLLAKDPAARYQTAAELMHVLAALHREQDDPAALAPEAEQLPATPAIRSGSAPSTSSPAPTLAGRRTEPDFPPMPAAPGVLPQPPQASAAPRAGTSDFSDQNVLLPAPAPTGWWRRGTHLGRQLSATAAGLARLVRKALAKVRGRFAKRPAEAAPDRRQPSSQ